ncbi:hypothetical protein DSCA_44450 [Desulfosarcina alkanivorans]|jgi:hypothetical protein|uniref:Uncharacterized protein n=1 Tax=Desulfosarcina alkanivorans TaxID=571177 RepID=A0A5K7YQB3_9BACT|nr:hypothetical protein [Desulfosarcina alkanivorans]BBO70515.1 hypothetical protein DSCA_44450 [Desulfosarcina alkanivorans]
MLNSNIEWILIYGLCAIVAVLFWMILTGWVRGYKSDNWTPFEKALTLLALLLGNLQYWQLFIANIGETTDAPKT